MSTYVPVVVQKDSVYVFRNSSEATCALYDSGGELVCAEVTSYPDALKDVFSENPRVSSVEYKVDHLSTMWGDLYDTLRGRYVD